MQNLFYLIFFYYLSQWDQEREWWKSLICYNSKITKIDKIFYNIFYNWKIFYKTFLQFYCHYCESWKMKNLTLCSWVIKEKCFWALAFWAKIVTACPNFTKNNLALTFSHTNRLQETRGLYLTLFLSYQGKMLLGPLLFEQKSTLACPNFTKNNLALTFSYLIIAIRIYSNPLACGKSIEIVLKK